jgi:D-beta-D-heptose 7-phosphate kinase/D-beta-D-heptose 1-phosphate adenosyltransferase
MNNIAEDRARRIFGAFPRRRVLVVGDCMLDHWLWGTVNRISPEAPVPVVDVERSTYTAGGAANVVHNLCKLGAQSGIVGTVGDDDNGRRLREMLADEGAEVHGLIALPGRPTTTKTRIIAHSQQVVRADTECREAIGGEATRRLLEAVDGRLGDFEAILFSDYNKGVLTPALIDPLLATARARGVPIVAQPKPENTALFADVTVLAVNEREARGATGIACDSAEGVERAGRELLSRRRAQAVLITRGHRGMSLVEGDLAAHHVPALARQVYDVSGAGDTVVSVLTLALVAGASLIEAVQLANLAAAVVVEKVGTATVEVEEIIDVLNERRP